MVGSRRMRPDVKLRPSRMRRLAGDAPVNLGKDDVYTLSFSYRAQRAANPEKMEVTIGKSEYGTRHTVKLVDLPKITNTKMETVTIKLPIEEDGAYYVGFHCYSGTDSYYLWLDNVKLSKTEQKPDRRL